MTEEIVQWGEILPFEVLLNIFGHLNLKDVINTTLCCRKFYQISSGDNELWKSLFAKVFGAIEWFLLKTYSTSYTRYQSIVS